MSVYVYTVREQSNLSCAPVEERTRSIRSTDLLLQHSMHDDIGIPIRALLARSFQAVRRDLVRALVEDVADCDGDVDTTNQKKKSQSDPRQPATTYGDTLCNSPRRTRLLPARAADSHAHDPRVADLAERRREAAGDFARLVAAGGQLVCAGGDVGRRGLVAGAGGREGGWEDCGCEGDEGGGGEVHFRRFVFVVSFLGNDGVVVTVWIRKWK